MMASSNELEEMSRQVKPLVRILRQNQLGSSTGVRFMILIFSDLFLANLFFFLEKVNRRQVSEVIQISW